MLLPHFRSPPETWVELPKSKYGIEYLLGEGINSSTQSSHRKGVARFLRSGTKRPTNASPFELMLQRLSNVTVRDGHNAGTALMYMREIFEPGDGEFDYVGDYVCASQLSQEQVERIRIMILPWKREAKLLSYLQQFGSDGSAQRSLFSVGSTVLGDFDSFHRHFLSLDDPREKFDELFGFSFAIKHHSEWIFQYENQRRRENMIGNLAKHWRNLVHWHSPQKLGLDAEFSYPALLDFFNKFKILCDSIETFGSPPISFVFNTIGKTKRVTFNLDEDDETVSSLTHGSYFSTHLTDLAKPKFGS
ncbi:hypothetical protein IV203_007081 [Nitzschia inconspicua]|uniref:Uncharacterized protein n=1 Tax=Nitzschia inconspicua TaxID=303405 RepID=A0A9K3KE18_9STRA|nr:hypothetical protein IV203_007081 [Nitzschia inconspicua]